MSPEAQARIKRVVQEVWLAASRPGAAKDTAAQQRMVAYAEALLETAVNAEVERRVGELGLG